MPMPMIAHRHLLAMRNALRGGVWRDKFSARRMRTVIPLLHAASNPIQSTAMFHRTCRIRGAPHHPAIFHNQMKPEMTSGLKQDQPADPNWDLGALAEISGDHRQDQPADPNWDLGALAEISGDYRQAAASDGDLDALAEISGHRRQTTRTEEDLHPDLCRGRRQRREDQVLDALLQGSNLLRKCGNGAVVEAEPAVWDDICRYHLVADLLAASRELVAASSI